MSCPHRPPARRARSPLGLAASAALLGLGLAAAFAAACAGPRDRGPGYLARVALIDYVDGRRWELRSESHTAPVELYSEPRGQADVKIASDEILAAFVTHMEAGILGRAGRPGSAPGAAPARVVRAFEIEVGGATRHLLNDPGGPREAITDFNRLTLEFLSLYNEVQAFQSMETDPGRGPLGPDLQGAPR